MIAWFVASVFAGDVVDATCPADAGWLDGHQHLRALSLDLRGVVPSPEDEARLVDGEVPEDLVDEWLDSPEFAQRVVRHHRSLLWNNVSNLTLLTNNAYLSSVNGIYWRRNLADEYRGKSEQHCGDFPATLDVNGRPVGIPTGDGGVEEGWVEVHPYWDPDPDGVVKICGFDAQTAETSPLGTDCSSLQGLSDPYCGCGPELRTCAISSYHREVAYGFGEDVDRRVASMIEQDRSYLDLLTGTRGFVNGPMVHFYKYQSEMPGGARFVELPVDADVLPDLAFTDSDTWVEVDLGPQHAGVLTSPAWLLRFQTNRARANRFYNSFLCQPFQPPDGGIPEAADGSLTLDLTTRDGCKYCHALLEP
ncbi:MAG: hypothetical protein KC621_08255, partial [Myxococcales bacterium]|nr:hypothetical protein [Myxococcales bacterium]